MEEQGKYGKAIYPHKLQECATSSNRWSLPPAGSHKVNVDASLVVDGRVGLGVIACDCAGIGVFVATP